MSPLYKQGRSGLFLPAGVGGARQPNVVRFGNLRIWAEEGLVNWVIDDPDSEENGKSGSLSVPQARKRFRRVFASVGTSTQLGIARDAYDLKQLKSIADALEEVFRQAQEQSPSPRPKIVPVNRTKLVWQKQKLVERPE